MNFGSVLQPVSGTYLGPYFSHYLVRTQVNILAYDYTGYGKAQGVPNEQSCYRNIEAAYAHLTETLLHSPENIIL